MKTTTSTSDRREDEIAACFSECRSSSDRSLEACFNACAAEPRRSM